MIYFSKITFNYVVFYIALKFLFKNYKLKGYQIFFAFLACLFSIII